MIPAQMKYNNDNVRRRDRLMDEQRAIELLRNGEYGVLSMCGEGGEPYGIPLNYVWDGHGSLYVHCAPEGRKLRLLAENSRVSFCIVGRTRPIPDRFTTEYESIVISGTAYIGLSDSEKMEALRLLIAKFSPGHEPTGEKYAVGSFHRVEIIRIDVEELSGKRKTI